MSGKIDHQLFTAHEHALEHDPCPKCSGELSVRHSKNGPFLGCSVYPKCDYIKPLHQNDGHIVKALGVACPSCQSELVLRQGRYGMFIGCSSYPDCNHIESLDHKEEDKDDDASFLCPECSIGHLVERKSRFGKVFYACDNFPKCKFALNQQPRKGKCEQCGYPLLVDKHTQKGDSIQCANRKCQHTQGS
ncbi:DNA topoisomerase [Vibrio sp. MACH09]|uniref:DNA topoisomerase family protein n=1 Tax=Vibrio sp. MACH09 TaxID=3025122 RepID=UPI00279369D8|nr:topoisomerase DNA-binding C4 zinc finger domain-containing protein [Vibrio sp. MACH09]GLO62367.1 DNA topoisomerase [Vibrio sp. MACH09]